MRLSLRPRAAAQDKEKATYAVRVRPLPWTDGVTRQLLQRSRPHAGA